MHMLMDHAKRRGGEEGYLCHTAKTLTRYSTGLAQPQTTHPSSCRVSGPISEWSQATQTSGPSLDYSIGPSLNFKSDLPRAEGNGSPRAFLRTWTWMLCDGTTCTPLHACERCAPPSLRCAMRLETRWTYLGVQRKAYTALRAATLIPLHHTFEGLDTFFN